MILADMEGAAGIDDYRMTTVDHPARYAEGRKQITADVNAAVAGLKAAGVTDIVVVDGHGSGNQAEPDVLEAELLAPAVIGFRDAPFDIYVDSYDHTVDAIVAVGMHAGAGNSRGFLSHTYTFHDVEYKVNGVPFNEGMLLAAGAARLRIPVIAMAGDDQLEVETRRMLPWVKYATVKRAVDRTKAELLPRAEASRRIETAVRDAAQQWIAAASPASWLPQWAGPYRITVTFQDEAQARNAMLLSGAEPWFNALMVQVRGNDFEEAYRRSILLMRLGGQVHDASSVGAVLSAQPDAARLETAITDRDYARFLGTLPESPSSPRRRFWGAR
jgi:D-amino peptidase